MSKSFAKQSFHNKSNKAKAKKAQDKAKAKAKKNKTKAKARTWKFWNMKISEHGNFGTWKLNLWGVHHGRGDIQIYH